MSSLPNPVARSASTGANKKNKLTGIFHRHGHSRDSPVLRKRATSDYHQHLVRQSNALKENGSMESGDHRCNTMMSCPAGFSVSPPPSLEVFIEPDTWKLHHFSSSEVAEELCLMDGEMLRKIDPEELHNGTWMKKEKEQLAPNVLTMVRTSNELAMMVPSEILEETTPHGRAKRISSFIKLASKLHRLRNYNSLKAVLAGLQCTPIFRLKKSWKEVPSKKRKRFEKLSDLMSEEYNWKLYRSELEDCFTENIPCIPFLGVLLTTIVQQETVTSSRGGHQLSRRGRKRISGVEMYTILEAITVRNRLERLRKQSSNWRLSGIPAAAENKRPAFVRSQSHFAKSSHIITSDSNISQIAEVEIDDDLTIGHKNRALIVGDSSGSEDEEKRGSIIGTLRTKDDREDDHTRDGDDSESTRTESSLDSSRLDNEDLSTLGTSSSDSEITPDLSPVMLPRLPRSTRLTAADNTLRKKKLRRVVAELNLPKTNPFPSHAEGTAMQPLMKNSVSDSIMINDISSHSNSCDIREQSKDSTVSNPTICTHDCDDPLPTGERGETTKNRLDVISSLSPVEASSKKEELTLPGHVNKVAANGGSPHLALGKRCSSDDRVRKVTVLEPPAIEDLYDAHIKEYAEVSRSLESLKGACDDLNGGPLTADSADFVLKQVNGELTIFIPKSLSLQSFSSIDGSLESQSSSSITSDTSSQPSNTNVQTCPASHLDDTHDDNAFTDDDGIFTDTETSVSERQRLRSNSIDDVFAGLDDLSNDRVVTPPPLRRRRSSDFTGTNLGINVTSAEIDQDRKENFEAERSRKASYGPVRRRSRRKASLVLRLAQLGTESKTFNSDDHLFKYKFVSLRYSSDYESLPELRTLLSNRPRNTEGQNYKLSYEREK